LKTLGVVEVLEAMLDVPVVSSSPAGFWDVVQLVGVNPTSNNRGRLFKMRVDNSDSSV
jgi:arylmalonate decarboxylase